MGRRAFLVTFATLVTLVTACELALPLHESADASGVDAFIGDDASDASSERPFATGSMFCGPSLTCPLNTPAQGCCVLFGDSGSPPENFQYLCVNSSDECGEAGAPFLPAILQCDSREDCNPNQVCCWASTKTPRQTFCFGVDSGSSCVNELCDPSDAVPCLRHPGFNCAPTRDGWPTQTSPLGYFVCRDPTLGP